MVSTPPSDVAKVHNFYTVYEIPGRTRGRKIETDDPPEPLHLALGGVVNGLQMESRVVEPLGDDSSASDFSFELYAHPQGRCYSIGFHGAKEVSPW